jgi:hypothetical protein
MLYTPQEHGVLPALARSVSTIVSCLYMNSLFHLLAPVSLLKHMVVRRACAERGLTGVHWLPAQARTKQICHHGGQPPWTSASALVRLIKTKSLRIRRRHVGGNCRTKGFLEHS